MWMETRVGWDFVIYTVVFKLKQHEYFEHFESYALPGLDLLLSEDLPVFVSYFFSLKGLGVAQDVPKFQFLEILLLPPGPVCSLK